MYIYWGFCTWWCTDITRCTRTWKILSRFWIHSAKYVQMEDFHCWKELSRLYWIVFSPVLSKMSHRRLIDQLEYKDRVITPPNHHYRIKEVINQPQVSRRSIRVKWVHLIWIILYRSCMIYNLSIGNRPWVMVHNGPICNLRKMNFYKGTCKVFDIISHRELALYFIFYSGKA